MHSNQSPRLSIVMPTFNGAAYLDAALASIPHQLDPQECEVILVDDGSTDATVQIAQQYRSRLPLRIVTLPHTGNWIANTSYGMQLAQGHFLTWLHQDDLWNPGRWASIRQFMQSADDRGILIHPAVFINAKGNRLGSWKCPLPAHPMIVPGNEVVRRWVIQNFIAASTPVFSKSLVDLAGLPDKRYWYCGDWEYWLRLFSAGQVHYLPQPLISVRLHAASQTSRCYVEWGDVERQYAEVINRHLYSRSWAPHGKDIANAARFSARLNIEIARRLGGERMDLWGLLRGFIALGPNGVPIYLRNSGLIDRTKSRIRAGLLNSQHIMGGNQRVRTTSLDEGGTDGRLARPHINGS